MRGAVFRGDRRIEVLSFDDPKPGSGEVIVEMKASGLCGSDLHFYRNNPAEFIKSVGFKDFAARGIDPDAPIIAGHEPCGVIAEVGAGVDARHFKRGDRVTVFHYAGCGFCDHCRTGWTQMCDDGATIYGVIGHGGHADYLKVPATSLVHLPDEISFVGGAAISCGTGTAYGALMRLNISARDTLVVFGLGPVGLSAAQLASAMGVEVIGVDISEERVQRSKEFGVVHAINAANGDVDVVEEVKKLTHGVGANCAMDCAGGEIARASAVRSTAPWGRIALVAVGGNLNVDGIKDVISKQRTIIGSYTVSEVGMKQCAQFIADHGVDVDKLFSDRWDLDQADQAYQEFDKQSGGKGVFVF
jgi:(R,R)-butanediol dehydrogenase / meso-butanediol dehydrogenase / diacetyl reductase